MTKIEAAISKYRNYMTEIRHRTDVINRALEAHQNGGALTGFRESDIELIYLQFRHCLELMMFASLSAHYAHGYELSRRITNKEYNATKLLRFLRPKNPRFYPNPVEVRDIENHQGMNKTIPITENFLTQEDFCSLYDKTCGNMLHAHRSSKFDGGHGILFQDATFYRDRMVRLLNCHWIHLDADIALRVIMKSEKTGGVGIALMQASN